MEPENIMQGMIAGHAYYFLEDVYPRMTGRRPLKTPSFIKALFADENVVVERPANVRFAPPAAEEMHRDWMGFWETRTVRDWRLFEL